MDTRKLNVWKNEFFGDFTRTEFDDKIGFWYWKGLYRNLGNQEGFIVECIGDEDAPNAELIDWLKDNVAYLKNHTSLSFDLEWLTRKYNYKYEQYYDWMDYYKIIRISIDEIAEDNTIWCDITFQYLENPEFEIVVECYNLISSRVLIGNDIIQIR